MPRAKKSDWSIQRAQFTDLVAKTEKSRAKTSVAGIDEGLAGRNLHRNTGFDIGQIERLAAAPGGGLCDFAMHTDAGDVDPSVASASQAGRNDATKVLTSDHVHGRDEAFDQDSLVLMFSLDGSPEAENLHFPETVFSAVRRGGEIFYVFPDNEIASKSRKHFEELTETA